MVSTLYALHSRSTHGEVDAGPGHLARLPYRQAADRMALFGFDCGPYREVNGSI